ncbi:MAG TPA: hypothetical protein VGO78_27285 [Acidimicrobiales bacterium]|nr:hypothetical protein [Acidimicrobiales bacterium]
MPAPTARSRVVLVLAGAVGLVVLVAAGFVARAQLADDGGGRGQAHDMRADLEARDAIPEVPVLLDRQFELRSIEVRCPDDASDGGRPECAAVFVYGRRAGDRDDIVRVCLRDRRTDAPAECAADLDAPPHRTVGGYELYAESIDDPLTPDVLAATLADNPDIYATVPLG